jgi:hypothetical protein
MKITGLVICIFIIALISCKKDPVQTKPISSTDTFQQVNFTIIDSEMHFSNFVTQSFDTTRHYINRQVSFYLNTQQGVVVYNTDTFANTPAGSNTYFAKAKPVYVFDITADSVFINRKLGTGVGFQTWYYLRGKRF